VSVPAVNATESAGIYNWDTTPADSVALTAGTDTVPTLNYVFLLQSTKTLTVSTSGWPATEHARIATVLCQTAVSAQTDGVYKTHAWTDHTASSDGQGHLGHLNAWIRQQPASWVSGAVLTPTVGASVFDLATTQGTVLQLHDHAFPAFDTAAGSELLIVNDSVAAFARVGDLTGLDGGLDADGVALGNFYNLVVWGVVSEDTVDCQLMVNLPSGSYANNAGDKATLDDDRTAIFAIPSEFTGTGFLIARLTVQLSGATFVIVQQEDLRGLTPSSSAGGGSTGGGGGSEFNDDVFRVRDNLDESKQVAFQASGLTTATTRTITMADADVDLGATVAAVALNTAKVTNATHTGDVTGDTALTLDATAITGQTLVTADVLDHVVIADASDGGALKKALVSDLGADNFVQQTGAPTGDSGLLWFDTDAIPTPQNVEPTTTETGTTHTLGLVNGWSTVVYSNAAAVTVTVPTNASVAFPVETTMLLVAAGAGGISLTTTSLTLIGSSPSVGCAQNEALWLRKVGTDTWIVLGGTV